MKSFVLLLLTALSSQTSDALSHPKSSTCTNCSNQIHSTSTSTSSPSSSSSLNRRSFLSAPPTFGAFIPLIIPIVGTSSNPKPAEALKPKNDALCGTGFFEHIYEYKCTAIGDIEDEGKTKEMNSNEVGITDSLLGKLNLSGSLDADLAEGSDKDSSTKSNTDEAKKK